MHWFCWCNFENMESKKWRKHSCHTRYLFKLSYNFPMLFLLRVSWGFGAKISIEIGSVKPWIQMIVSIYFSPLFFGATGCCCNVPSSLRSYRFETVIWQSREPPKPNNDKNDALMFCCNTSEKNDTLIQGLKFGPIYTIYGQKFEILWGVNTETWAEALSFHPFTEFDYPWWISFKAYYIETPHIVEYTPYT